MTLYRTYLLLFLLPGPWLVYSQDTTYAREVISRLCDRGMHGRGYLQDGDHRAAKYIRSRFEADGVKPLGTRFFQSLPIDINTFPGAMKVSMNGKLLVPGRDFIIHPSSPGLHGSFDPFYIKASDLLKGKSDLILDNAINKILIADARDLETTNSEIMQSWNKWKNSQQSANPYKIKALIEITDEKLIYGASVHVLQIPVIIIKGSASDLPVAHLKIHIKNKYLEDYRTHNVAGYIPGTICPDSFLVYTAHYDHLGKMGRNTYFPGANDNASGTAMMLGLARYFSLNPQRYSVVFIGFTGEEAGLTGSFYFADHPLISLTNIKFLVNLDLVGTGNEGITVVNATEFPDQFELINQLNDSGRFLPNIKKRGKACNSDHCPFYSKGVPCFFIYTLGGIAAYHDIDDRPETLPLDAFEGLAKLLIAFGEKQ